MYNLAIRRCTSPTLLASEVENFQMKIYYIAGERTPDLLNQRQACYHLRQHGEPKSRESIFEAAKGGTKRKKVKSSKYEDIEKIKLEWIHQSRDASVLLSGPIIQQKGGKLQEN